MTLVQLVQVDDHQWIDPTRIVALRQTEDNDGQPVTLITLDVQGGPFPLRTTASMAHVIDVIRRAIDG